MCIRVNVDPPVESPLRRRFVAVLSPLRHRFVAVASHLRRRGGGEGGGILQKLEQLKRLIKNGNNKRIVANNSMTRSLLCK